jgi:hypothetical protein
MAIEETRISDSLVLRSVRDEKDMSGFSALLAKQLNIIEGLTSNGLLRFHPLTQKSEFQVVEDTSTGQIVSTSCLVPWNMSFAGVPLRCSMLEMFYTLPAHRNKGLVRVQIERLHRMINEKGDDLAIIWGIPYYYRQYGYSYAVDGMVSQSLPAWRIDEAPAGAAGRHRLREAGVGDVPVLCEFYTRATSSLDVRLERSPEHWRYMIEKLKFPVFIVEETDGGRPAGYLIRTESGRMVHVLESGVVDHEAGMSVLRLLKREHDEILINWPQTGTLVKLSESLGSVRVRNTQWLFRVPDMRALLLTLRPLFDRRLQASDCRALNKDFILNLFRGGYRIEIREGRIADVQSVGFVDTSMGAEGGDLNIHPDAFIRLLLGHSSVDDVYDSWPDLVLRPEDRGLVNTLFPKMTSYLYTPYHYYGPELYALEEKFRKFYL